MFARLNLLIAIILCAKLPSVSILVSINSRPSGKLKLGRDKISIVKYSCQLLKKYLNMVIYLC